MVGDDTPSPSPREPMTDSPKTLEELLALGGRFYEMQGEAWCDTPLDSWKLVPGVGWVRWEEGAEAEGDDPC